MIIVDASIQPSETATGGKISVTAEILAQSYLMTAENHFIMTTNGHFLTADDD